MTKIRTARKYTAKQCNECGSYHTNSRGAYKTKKKGILRKWYCANCGHVFARPA